MPLTTRNTGDAATPAVVNDFKDLLTGVMQDQAVAIKNLLQVKSRAAAPAAPTAAVAAGGAVDAGAHTYAVTFVDAAGGETVAGATVVATTAGGNLTVNLTAIPTGATGTTSRKIYRSKAGTTTPLFLVTTLANNTATTYSDTATDASLSATQSPSHPSFGGSTQWLDNTGAVKGQVFSDGAISFDAGALTSSGTGILSATTYQWGSGASGSLSKISYDGANHATDYWTPQAGASAQGHQFVTWDGAASKIPFSIGIQVFALSYVDNAGHFYDNGKNIPLIQPNGTTAGRQIFLGTATPTGANEGDIWIKA